MDNKDLELLKSLIKSHGYETIKEALDKIGLDTISDQMGGKEKPDNDPVKLPPGPTPP